MSNQHVLKIHPVPLADLLSGAKTAEVRRNDRGFQVGDTVRLMEVNPETDNWTGAADHVRTISHIQTGYGLPDGMCVLSYAQPFTPRNRLPGRLAIRAALPDVPGDMLDHGLFAALDAMGAQAEQQEAQGAQAGDERPAFEEECMRRAKANGRILDHHHFDRSIQTGKYFKAVLESQWGIWQARAALDTQPAAGEPVATLRLMRSLGGLSVGVVRFDAEQLPHGALVDVFAAPPAAHGDESVRKDAEAAYVAMSCNSVLIDGSTCYYLPAERMAAFDRMFSLGDAMRAQAGEGGEV